MSETYYLDAAKDNRMAASGVETDTSQEAVKRIAVDAETATSCMVETDTFPTGQGILKDCAKYLRTLADERDALQSELDATAGIIADKNQQNQELREEVERLRGALEGIANWHDVVVTMIDETDCNPEIEEEFSETLMLSGMWLTRARAALKGRD